MLNIQECPHRVFLPLNGKLLSRIDNSTTTKISQEVTDEIKDMVSQKNFPCVAALRSFHKDDYQVGFYAGLGSGRSWRELRADLTAFVAEQKKTSSIYLTFWAIFENNNFSEEEFEKAMWHELSSLTSVEEKAKDWTHPEHADPNQKAFRFSLDGTEFFVVGLHSKSSRLGRRFSRPALVFNVFDQFEQLERLGQYDAMVEMNRQRDLKFQGTVNPMVAEYGDKWEAIQFSGKENSSDWKCPFRFLKKDEKP